MKKHLLLLFAFCAFYSFSQAPKEINYQGVLRNTAGNPIGNKAVKIKFDIYPSLAASTAFFTETQNLTTNFMGLFTTQIGKTSALNLNWSTGSWFLEVSFDTTNTGTSYISLGRQKMVSVPYALYAETAGNSTTYSASPNINISSSNILDLTPTGVTAGSYGANTLFSEIPKFSVDINGRITSAGSYSANLLGDISGPLNNQTVSKLNGTPLSATAPSTGQVLQFNGTNWSPANIATGGVTTINTTGPIAGGPISSVGTISMQASGVTAGVYGSTLATVPIFTVNSYGLLTNASSYVLSIPGSTLNGDVKGTFLTNTVTAIQGFSVLATTPTVGQVLQYNATGQWQPTTPPAGPWIKPTGTTVTLANNSDFVGIGVSSPIAKLDISDNSTLTTLAVNNSSNGNYINSIFSSNSSLYTTRITNDGSGLGMYVYKSAVASSGGAGTFGILNPANSSDVVIASTSGAGRAIYAENSSSVNPTIELSNLGSSYVLRAMKIGAQTGQVALFNNGSSANSSDVVTITNSGGGNALNVSGAGAGDVLVVNGSNASAALNGINANISSTSSNASAIKGKNNGGAGYGVFGENSSTGYGVYGVNSNNSGVNVYGVYGTVTGNNAANAGVFGSVTGNNTAILGNNNGTGISVYGLKPATANGGSAGRFEIQNAANTADALFATTQGVGAAVHAVAGTATTSALALLLEQGHVSSTGTSPTQTVITSLVGGTASLLSTSTDVAGRITVTFGTGPFTSATYVGVNFNKPYTFAPIVILTPVSAAAATANVHVTSTTTGFTITHDSAPGASSSHVFNYIVIETK